MTDPWKRREVVGDAVIYAGDCREVMCALITEGVRVQMCVTSPPYWGLRDYGTEPQLWGGDPECAHEFDDFIRPGLSGGLDNSVAYTENQIVKPQQQQQQCKKCAAWRGSFGLEPTPQMYVDHCVEVFGLVRDLLADDGTLWLNIGDSYARDAKKGQHKSGDAGKQNYIIERGGGRAASTAVLARGGTCSELAPEGQESLKAKDLIGIPWRVAFALQADGWYLRQDLIWSKPNPMPESVRDRCTKAHEYIFLLSKSERYYYDADAIADPAVYPGDNRALRTDTRKLIEPFCLDNGSRARTGNPTGETRNKRSVWTVATQPYTEAHFATFPRALIEPCILAGCPVGGTVLDPFGGAGTTGLVAHQLDRKAILIDLNEGYADMSVRRIDRAQRQGKLFPVEPQAKPKQTEIAL